LLGRVSNVLDVVSGPDGLHDTLDTLVMFTFHASAAGEGEFRLENVFLVDDAFNSLPVAQISPAGVSVTPIPEPAAVGVVCASLLLLVLLKYRHGGIGRHR